MNTIGFIIFGGTGDLACKKLINSFHDLVKRNTLSQESYLVGIGRRDFSDSEYRAYVEKSLPSEIIKSSTWENIQIHYFRTDFSSKGFLENFPAFLKKLEKGKEYDRIYYLATSYFIMPIITEQIKEFGLHTHNEKFRRVIFEKPFGDDALSSETLNTVISRTFNEKDIYRIDHYLAKETVQNILTLRLGNPIFEAVWNSTFIERIIIAVEEDSGVKNRIGYYDTTGAIKDMIQSHLLQIASLVLMEAPEDYIQENIHNEKVKVLKRLQLSSPESLSIGQYETYRDEALNAGVTNSRTETYAKAILTCNEKRWEGTEIVLIAGKMLENRTASIEITFRKNPCKHLCKIHNIKPNKLIINIQPTQDIRFDFNRYMSDAHIFKTVNMEFCSACEFTGNTPNAYDILIKDCVNGDKTLFTRFDELQAAWEITDSIVAAKHSVPLHRYANNSDFCIID